MKRYTVSFAVRIEKKVYSAFENQCKKEGQKMTDIVRALIRRWVDLDQKDVKVELKRPLKTQ